MNLDTLGDSASTVRNYAFASFWVQLPLTIVSACILIFALLYSKGVSPDDRVFEFDTTQNSAHSQADDTACCLD